MKSLKRTVPAWLGVTRGKQKHKEPVHNKLLRTPRARPRLRARAVAAPSAFANAAAGCKVFMFLRTCKAPRALC